jgi:ribonucleoside-triphosphate reductase
MQEINVVKRNKSKELFDSNKIVKAIEKVFKSEGKEEIPELILSEINKIKVNDGSSVEIIQDTIEKILMSCGYYKEAKSYIIYRSEHNKTREFVAKKKKFINKFIKSDNTANSTIDDNSNVSCHNIGVLNAEIHKEDNQITNLELWKDHLKQLYPDFPKDQMDKDLDSIMYFHDLSSQIGMPYCVAISLYPFLLNGLKDLGGQSAKPENIDSFCGLLVNLVFNVSSNFKGALAIPGTFLSMDYFCRKEWGDNYFKNKDSVISSDNSKRKKTIGTQLNQYFQQITYSINQPAAARGLQSAFVNFSFFDEDFYKTMYGDFYFPDGTKPVWNSFNWLQQYYLNWLNQERLKCLLTFPVCSYALIYKDGEFQDKQAYEFVCKEYSEGDSFFTYISDSADSLSSCCRLSSKLSKPQFNFTNGQIGEMTGSKNVITLNMNRIIQDCIRETTGSNNWHTKRETEITDGNISNYLTKVLDRVYKYQEAYNDLMYKFFKNHMFPVYDAGFIDLDKQYLTIGINGLNQAAEYLGFTCNYNDDYRKFCNLIFGTIKEQNAKHKTKHLMFNTEFTPCESAAVKLYNRDKSEGYWVPKDTNLYASYIFKPNDTEISILNKFKLHGDEFCGDKLDGGQACHVNLDSHMSYEQYKKIVKYSAEVGCKYFTFNVPNSECQDCGYITKHPITECPKCHSKNIDYYDRIIGYLTKLTNWSSARQKEQKTRSYGNMDDK